MNEQPLEFYPTLTVEERLASLPKKLFVSFSGGRSSAYMAYRIKTEYAHFFDELVFAFANTGEETEETLIFTERCSREWSLDLVWIEAVIHHGEKLGPTHNVVNFETASRHGEPFEEVIRKYGIPNQAGPICSKALKTYPLRSYLRSIGWKTGTYLTALGMRADEPKRLKKKAKNELRVYPLAEWFPVSKPEINDWWEEQDFNLALDDTYKGNCKWCWKKSTPKLIRIAKETPEVFSFPILMEERYGMQRSVDGRPSTFFRGRMSAQSLIQISQTSVAPPVHSDEADSSGGCSESCEAFVGDESDEQELF